MDLPDNYQDFTLDYGPGAYIHVGKTNADREAARAEVAAEYAGVLILDEEPTAEVTP
ncbi:hypothetical protein LLS1_18430 [Leifsonia sp. LS1]|uniref:hypothetical protein n=1 Tax=Leifsonia sp. LS1 TaxID=2828483 RepID=UPI001CFF2477|nr:hypothetical protein [Leifsonia sp. LS1]GIT80174.1 hypothetical protein LLS1_18430 [Leifsonia sp. LS1]